jgi:hypothetical protein
MVKGRAALLANSAASAGMVKGRAVLLAFAALAALVAVPFSRPARIERLEIIAAPQLQFPAPPGYWEGQEPTVWAGRGGNKQEAELDDALHASQMQRMRTKVLDEQVEQQRSQWDVMNEAAYLDAMAQSEAHSQVPLSLTPAAKKADAMQQMLMYGNVEFPEERFSWKKESGAPQCEDGCAFQDKVFTVDGFDQLCISHCGEIDGMLKDASKGQRAGVQLAQRVVRQLAQPRSRLQGATMLSELDRRLQRKEQAHEPWNVDSASSRTGRMERSKYIQMRKERYDRGETASARFPSDDKYPLEADWGVPSRRPAR